MLKQLSQSADFRFSRSAIGIFSWRNNRRHWDEHFQQFVLMDGFGLPARILTEVPGSKTLVRLRLPEISLSMHHKSSRISTWNKVTEE